jgi:hypothetical protein
MSWSKILNLKSLNKSDKVSKEFKNSINENGDFKIVRMNCA